MKKEDILKCGATPLSASPVPLIAHRFYGREYLYIYYETDPEALRKVLPEPLEPIETPLVRFELMKMADSTGFGSYCESGQAIPCQLDGVRGDYLHMMYLDNFEAIAAGRELHAYPKKLGWPKLFVDDNTLIGTLDYGKDYKFRIANATMDYKYHPMAVEEALHTLTEPTFMLKMMRDYNGRPIKCELARVDTPIDKVKILESWTGDARLQLFDHVKCPLNDLPVRRIVKAEYIIADITLGRPRPVYDYLTVSI